MSHLPLINLAQRASRNSSLIARLVAIHIEAEQKSWEQFAEDLEVTSEQLARLALCNRPREREFTDDILQIATYVKIDRNKLIRFIRRSAALETMQSSQQTQWLLAARDKDIDSETSDGDEK